MDSHLFSGYMMPPYYDSLLAKVVVWGSDRAEAMARMRRALLETRIAGVTTNLPFHIKLLDSDEFLSGSYDTKTVEKLLAGAVAADMAGGTGAVAGA